MRPAGLKDERLAIFWIGLYGAVALLGARLLHVQVIRNVYYTRVAEANRTQIIPQTAPRGRVFDRQGRLIAANRPAFSLIYLPGKGIGPTRLTQLAESLAHELHQDKEALLGRLREAQREESVIHLAENLPLKTMFKLSELKTLYPGVDLIFEARRHYARQAFASHLLGYMGRMDKRSWRAMKGRGYRVDSWIGMAGLERLYEDELRGVDGEIRMEVNAQGQLKRKLAEVPWRNGRDLHLTIDARIQEAVERGLRESPSGTGGAVVLDPRSGELLAYASIPDYDPNLFLLPEWDEAKKELRDFPAFNRPIAGTYAPGSTFKIIVSAAMLEEHRVRPSDRVFCPGRFQLGDRIFKCWEKKGHRLTDWMGGITNSCDVYFYQKGLRTGGRLIEKYAQKFGLGRATGLPFPGERSGNMFGPEARKAKKRGWYDGDTVNLSIGQGELLTTPAQMAVVIAAVATRGTLWKPLLAKRILQPDGTVAREMKAERAGKVELSSATWELLHQGLVSVVKNGTGRRVDIPGLTVAGKTGTSQNPLGEDHAWFVAYAGREGEAPSLAISVLVEHGGHGSSAAGPVARKVIEAAFNLASKDGVAFEDEFDRAARPGAPGPDSELPPALPETVVDPPSPAGPEAPDFPTQGGSG